MQFILYSLHFYIFWEPSDHNFPIAEIQCVMWDKQSPGVYAVS